MREKDNQDPELYDDRLQGGPGVQVAEDAAGELRKPTRLAPPSTSPGRAKTTPYRPDSAALETHLRQIVYA